MTSYFIIRLGADSESEIKRINAFSAYSSGAFNIDVKCKQVPKVLADGDVAIIWLGTNNNKGGKTPWVQGIRALGRIKGVSGEGGYGATKTVRVSIGVVLPQSVTKMDIVTKQSALYPEIAAMPVLGVNNYSSQVVQRIEASEPGQSLYALFSALESIAPGLQLATLSAYADLEHLFDKSNSQESLVGLRGTLASSDSDDLGKVESIDASNNSLSEEDEDGLEPDESRDPATNIEVPFDPTKIDIIAKPMTISSLEDRLDNDELDLTPDFQRQANVWDTKRKARLIESILLRIPLPSFYFSEDLQGSYAVVDGLQRLCAVFHFKNAALLNSSTGASLTPLRLKGLQYLKDLEGKSYSDLDRKFQRRISELEITANIIRANTPSAVKFNVFARLNQGGMPLNAQEIRNAIFPGEWRNELRRLAESEEFIKATDSKVQTSRQQDMELVLRFIALWQLGEPYRRPGNQTLDEFLNFTVEHTLSRWSADKWKQAGEAFHHAIAATCQVRGKHAFRKSAGAQQRKPINRGLFEAELIAFGALDSKTLPLAIAHKLKIEELLIAALAKNKDLIQSLLYGTGSAESSNARIAALNSIVMEAIYA
ncbi:hypothetical protein A7D25_11460 [Pseudomonas sp. 21C1]|nr:MULTISPECIES: DUF262 domain-containing protein [Pseudomonas]OEC34954.1 hypothetical protein A7D25_11460 [Pseudomonas sp. 21C1]